MTVSRDDVIWCYRNLLNREPESELVIRQHGEVEDFRTLVRAFVESHEFRGHGRGEGHLPQLQRMNLPPLRIDWRATPSQLEAAWSKVRTTWEHLGKARPHFSVLTNPHFLPEKIDRSIDRFWSSGEAEVKGIERALARHGLPKDLSGLACVEYGCGVGRVSVPLARRFGKVHAYDISAAHLALAKARAAECGQSNVRFHQCKGSPRGVLEGCDFFYSRIVFQHNPPPIIRELILAALESLNPGGLAMFQVPTFIKNYRFAIKDWLEAAQTLDMEMHCLSQRAIFDTISEAKCRLVEVVEDTATGEPDKYASNVFFVRKPPARPATGRVPQGAAVPRER
jgi:SAM-dependent methyltransferase